MGNEEGACIVCVCCLLCVFLVQGATLNCSSLIRARFAAKSLVSQIDNKIDP
jgi:hypothetical protein